MESTTPKSRNYRKRFINPSTSSPYRSPLLSQAKKAKNEEKTAVSDMPLDELKKSVKELFEKNNSLKQQIQELEEKGYTEEKLQWYMDMMHRYNEVKDAAQIIMGRIAEMDQTTVKKVHEEFGMSEDD